MIKHAAAKRDWTIVAVMFDDSEQILNPDKPFHGDFFMVLEEADRLSQELDGVESFIYEAK